MIQLHSGCPGVRLLVVEDEKKVACFIKKCLEEEGFSVDVALDGETGIRLATAEAHDVIILDFRLLQMSGIEVVGALRRNGSAASVLLLSANPTVEEIVLGLDSGADDFLAKPFVSRELAARIQTLVRRRAQVQRAHLRASPGCHQESEK
ncbi:MAG TPA: response regulator [Syntrophobacteraceae bacterium]|nr:response regulator [Syntrophobacteraceae bacterium]